MSLPYFLTPCDHPQHQQLWVEAQKTIATLTAERDNLKRQLQTAVESCLTLTYKLDEMEKERDALRADLRAVLQYPLRHNMCCASLDIAHVVEHDEVPPCDCGRDEALARPGVQAVVKD